MTRVNAELKTLGIPSTYSYSLWAWGENTNGQLGDNTVINKSSPAQVVGGHSFVQVIATALMNIVFARKADGTVWAWGDNYLGQLGDGTTINRSSPTQVIGGHSFVSIVSGYGATHGLKADGSVWSWGENSNGELGDGTTTNTSSPVQAIGGHSFVKLFAREFSSVFALKANGQIWGWGINGGLLADGTATAKSSPVQVIGGHSFTDLFLTSGYGSGMFAKKADNTIWAWGDNSNGQLGLGDTTSRSSPTQIIGGHTFVSINGIISQNFLYQPECRTYGIKPDGTIWAWGLNSNGQLGDNTIIDKSSPVAVAGGQSFTKVASSRAGRASALKADGSVWSWGTNYNGQLGDNTTTPQSSPVQAIGGHSFVNIAVGIVGTYGIKSSGTIWSWGHNGTGELGVGDISSRSSPTQVLGSNFSEIYDNGAEIYSVYASKLQQT
jgi:alpha-tubulin suppressor-like RCC1 family protein